MYEYEKQHRDNNSQKKKVKSKTSKYQSKDDNILQLKPLNSSSSVARKITIKVPSNISDRSMGSGTVIQRTEATVYVNSRERGEGRRARGGRGGVDHAEQLAWQQARQHVENEIARNPEGGVFIRFVIDSQVCEGCREWFEVDFWNQIQRMRGPVEVGVIISVVANDNYFATTLNGPGTIWGGVAVG